MREKYEVSARKIDVRYTPVREAEYTRGWGRFSLLILICTFASATMHIIDVFSRNGNL